MSQSETALLRAQQAVALAEQARGDAPTLAIGLYREGIELALTAHTGAAGALDALWANADSALLTKVAGGADAAAALRAQLTGKTHRDFAELDAAAQHALAAAARQVAFGLLAPLLDAQDHRDRRRLTRALHVGFVSLVVIGLLATLHAVWRRHVEGRDLAKSAMWQASSRWNGVGCTPPEQRCPISPDFFFHTNEEEQPWLRLDLGAVKQVGGIHIDNRLDCCSERAVPLVVELSTDGTQWSEAARRAVHFTSWQQSFSPQQARFVRVRAERRTMLHLQRVQVFPP